MEVDEGNKMKGVVQGREERGNLVVCKKTLTTKEKSFDIRHTLKGARTMAPDGYMDDAALMYALERH